MTFIVPTTAAPTTAAPTAAVPTSVESPKSGLPVSAPGAILLAVTDVTDAPTCVPQLERAAIAPADADSLARSLKALADPARLQIISIVAAHADAEACVCDLTDALPLSQPTISHHLKVLVDAGFLDRSKRGTWSYYSLVPGSLEAVAGILPTL